MQFFGTTMFAILLLTMGTFLAGNSKEVVTFIEKTSSMSASVFFTQSTTATQLRTTFKAVPETKKKLRILLVPGHEPNFGGAEYLDIKERDLNADLALILARYLVEDGHYEVAMTRGKDGWNPDFQNYFTAKDEEIKAFVRSQKMEMVRLIEEGKVFKMSKQAPHNAAQSDVALRLFGINKWANDHQIDMVIHIHFNDSFPRKPTLPGEHNGFTIYTPEYQYSNSQATAEIAKNIFKRLARMFPVSSLPKEDQGVVEDQDLIAVGNSNSVDAASMVIEYGYIYEPQLRTPDVRRLALKELAFQTYLGLADFFGEASLVAGSHGSTLLPYEGNTPVKKTSLANAEVFALQAALIDKGFYPPSGYTRNACPLSGLLGPRTRAALGAFQYKFGIKDERGVVGEKTRAELRKLFQPNLMSVRR